jgi:group I intron endonuclease
MFYTIYKITNLIDGKIYIGKHQTKDLNDGYMGSGKHLNRAKSKYGIENFTKEILFKFDSEVEMNAKEAELVTEEFCLREDTYNLCPGGYGGFGYINRNNLTPRFAGKRHKEESKKIMSEKSKLGISLGILKPFNSSTRLDWTGRTHSDEAKQKISNSMRGKQMGQQNSQYGSCWITNGIESKKINKDDPIPEGWNRGRKMT